MPLLICSLTIVLILSLLALCVFISFRIFAFPDITADVSITLAAAVAAMLLVRRVNPALATAAGAGAGALAGTITALLHTRFGINGLLSGILVMTGLYSANLHIMGKANVPLMSEKTLATMADRFGTGALQAAQINVLGWDVSARDASLLGFAVLAPVVASLL